MLRLATVDGIRGGCAANFSSRRTSSIITLRTSSALSVSEAGGCSAAKELATGLKRRGAHQMRLSLVLLSVVVGWLGMAPTATCAEPPVLLGIYPDGILQDPAAINQIKDIDTWLATPGRRIGIAGAFMGLEFPNPDWNVPHELNGAWSGGYVPFVNLLVSRKSAEIANGLIDSAISTWAFHFAAWAKNGTGPIRHAFLAPLPEMNGNWIPYYGPPADFVAAYRHIRQLFNTELQRQGVPNTAISWAFVPNAWSAAGDEFERFYPGHNDVDIVGFSSYNYGGCQPAAPWVKWLAYDDLFSPSLDRMSVMAPGKPIFITQTGTVDKPVNGVGDKDQWLRDTFTLLAAYPRLRAIIYFNHLFPHDPVGFPNCDQADFRLHLPGTTQWRGFKDVVTNPASNFGYWAPGSSELSQIVFAPTTPLLFGDVFPIHPFAAEPNDVDFGPWITRLYNSGVTSGCATNPLRFCPTDTVTRAQMAVFLLKAIRGSRYSPPAPSGTVFGDVSASHPFAKWIEQLARDGITGGCGPSTYCPDGAVTRGQMAVFLLRSVHGATYTPPAATGNVFSDVPAGLPLANWIERLAAEGITGGCGGGNYCPDTSMTRQQMAVFLVRAFNL